MFVETKHVFCRDKSVLAATILFVATKFYLSQQNIFVATNKHTFVATKDVFCVCRDKNDTCGGSRNDSGARLGPGTAEREFRRCVLGRERECK